MKLFQYWDTGEPPEDVAGCIESARVLNPGLDHQLFDRDIATGFIGRRLGPREREAFLSLAIPAMQADYFRLCALWAEGGVWSDADNRSLLPFRKLIAGAHGFISMADNLLQTDVLFVREPGDPFLRACLELATRHIEARLEGDAYHVTGPWIWNLIWAAVDPNGFHDNARLVRDPSFVTTSRAETVAALYPDAGAAFARFERGHENRLSRWVQWIIAGYKGTSGDWRQWRGPTYHEAAPIRTDRSGSVSR